MMKFNLKTDLSGLFEAVNKKVQVGQEVIDSEVIKGGNYFIPMDTHNLEGSSYRATVIGSGQVVWDTPYAKKLYYNPQYNFSKDQNPNAQGLWFEVAKTQFLTEWIQRVQNAIKKE